MRPAIFHPAARAAIWAFPAAVKRQLGKAILDLQIALARKRLKEMWDEE